MAAHPILAPSGVLRRVPLGHDEADACLQGGLMCGVLHEVFAASPGDEASATGFAMGLTARIASGRRLLWIRQDFSALEFGEISATGLLELGLDPGRLLLLRVADAQSALRAAADASSCAALGGVLLEIPGVPKILDLVASRRLLLAAAQKGVAIVLLRLSARPQPSAAETRWSIRPARSADSEDWGSPVFAAELLRNRHGTTGHWVMEWNCDRQIFRAPHSGAAFSLSSDGPPAAARRGSAA